MSEQVPFKSHLPKYNIDHRKAKDDFPRYYADQQIPRSVAERHLKTLKKMNEHV